LPRLTQIERSQCGLCSLAATALKSHTVYGMKAAD